jgi:serine/threonine protein kinase
MANPDRIVGTMIGERFKILRMIGQGGMGTVYEAEHKTLPRRFAVKILRPELTGDREAERFRREAIASARLEHPNIIYITDFGEMEYGSLYLVMEYLEGIGLDEVLSRQSRLPLSRALPILAQVADALDHAHKMDVVHRDLKPENIHLTEVRGKKDVVKLLDFGIAKMGLPEFAQSLTIQGQVFGTAEYMSPEQATGEGVDGRSDIYALGCLAYELITGDPPFLGPPVKVLRSQVNEPAPPPSTKLTDPPLPPALDAMVLRCLAKAPKDRYQSASDLRRDILKLRSITFSARAESASRRKASKTLPTISPERLVEGWASLGGKAPDLVINENYETTTHARVFDDRVKWRNNLQDQLRKLAFELVQEALAPKETSQALERLLVLEEEVTSLTGTAALAEQNFDRIRFDFSQREKRLRYALMDLELDSNELQAATDEASRARLKDLDYQTGELMKRIDELDGERSTQIGELAAQVKTYRELIHDLDKEGGEIYQTLHRQIEALRATASSDKLRVSYDELDTIRGRMGSNRNA